ncbi:MAG: hypothetical protein Q9195_001168 [Heterodermia aff. obscurata]
MAMTTMAPPEPNLETARVFLRTFRQVFDYKEQQTTLRLFLAAQPRVPANQAPAGDINECCIICRDRLWPANVAGNTEDPVKLTCCAKYIDAECLKLWLSSSYEGGGNAHTCPFCRQGLIPAWPVRNAINGFIENEVDNPMAGFDPVDLPIRWVPKWYGDFRVVPFQSGFWIMSLEQVED